MNDQSPVAIPNVVVISNGLVLSIEAKGGLRYDIPTHFVLPTSEVRWPGDRGTLVIPRWLAMNQGLL